MTYLHIFARFELRTRTGIIEPCWVVETFENEWEEFAPGQASTPDETIEFWCARILITNPGELQVILQGEEAGESAYFRIPLPLETPICFFQIDTDPVVIRACD